MYAAAEGQPAVEVFRCEKLRVSLTVTACAKRHRQARAGRAPFAASPCRGCPIGAQHAGLKTQRQTEPSTHGTGPYDIDWSAIDWHTANPKAVAARVGCHLATVYRHRARALGPRSRGGLTDPNPIPWAELPVGAVSDRVLGRLFSRSPEVVARHRIRHGWRRERVVEFEALLERYAGSLFPAEPDHVRALVRTIRALVHGYTVLLDRDGFEPAEGRASSARVPVGLVPGVLLTELFGQAEPGTPLRQMSTWHLPHGDAFDRLLHRLHRRPRRASARDTRDLVAAIHALSQGYATLAEQEAHDGE